MKSLEERGNALVAGGRLILGELGTEYRLLIVAVGPDGMVSHITHGADDVLGGSVLAALHEIARTQREAAPLVKH